MIYRGSSAKRGQLGLPTFKRKFAPLTMDDDPGGRNDVKAGTKHSAETRARMALAQLARFVSPETRQRIADSKRASLADPAAREAMSV